MNAQVTAKKKPAVKKKKSTTRKSTAAERKTAAKRKASASKPTAGKRPAGPAARARAGFDKNSQELLDNMKDVVYANLGLYGEIYDELQSRMEQLRKDTPARWQTLVKRGEKVEKEIEKAQTELRKSLEKAQSDLKKRLEKAQKDLRAKVEQIRPG